MTDKKDPMGDKLKEIEQAEAGRKAVKGKPIIARLDGRAFSTFTRGLARPFDKRMSQLMMDTTAFLIEETHAIVGYTQSDEITLCWFVPEDSTGTYMFDGKFQKLASVLSGMASSFFTRHVDERLPEKTNSYPIFDCRVWQVENVHDVYLNYKWRQDDAIKNSISMAAQAHYSHRKLEGVNSENKKTMLREIGHPWESLPQFFKSGTFLRRVHKEVELTEEQLEKIPPQHRPTGKVIRAIVEDINVGFLQDEKQDVEKLFSNFYLRDYQFIASV